MRDCVFLVADKNMEAAFMGFLGRSQFHQSLGCGVFEFDENQDLLVSGEHDPGVYTRAHELLRSYQKTHHHAVVALDEAWDGAPKAQRIEQKIRQDLELSGWEAEQVEVIVICPELEAWVCHDSPMVEEVLGCKKLNIGLKSYLVAEKLWEAAEAKPSDPKTGIEKILKLARMPRSSALYRRITAQISVKRCIDPAFVQLQAALQRWFPMQYEDDYEIG
jgi:hypothetical protein